MNKGELIEFCKKLYQYSAFLIFFPEEHKELGRLLMDEPKTEEDKYWESYMEDTTAPDEYPPDQERWVECIAECPTMNIVFGKEYRVYGSTKDNYVIDEGGNFEVIAKHYFKPKP